MFKKYFSIPLLVTILFFSCFDLQIYAVGQKAAKKAKTGKTLKRKAVERAPVVGKVAKKRYEREKGIARLYAEGLIKKVSNDLQTKVKKPISNEEKNVNLDITDIRVQAEFENFLKQGDQSGAKSYLISLGISPGRAGLEYEKREKEYNANQKKEEELKNLKKGFVFRLRSWLKFWKKEDEIKLSPSLARYKAKKELKGGFKVFDKALGREVDKTKEFDDSLNVAIYKRILEEEKSKYSPEDQITNANKIAEEAKKLFVAKMKKESVAIRDAQNELKYLEAEGERSKDKMIIGKIGFTQAFLKQENEKIEKDADDIISQTNIGLRNLPKTKTKKEGLVEDLFGSPGKFLTPEQRKIVEEELGYSLKLKTGLLPKELKKAKLTAQVVTGEIVGEKVAKSLAGKVKKKWGKAVK